METYIRTELEKFESDILSRLQDIQNTRQISTEQLSQDIGLDLKNPEILTKNPVALPAHELKLIVNYLGLESTLTDLMIDIHCKRISSKK